MFGPLYILWAILFASDSSPPLCPDQRFHLRSDPLSIEYPHSCVECLNEWPLRLNGRENR